VLFAIVFLWTPPHFWALAIKYRDDYARAGVPMLPVVATEAAVARRIILYSWAMVAVSLTLWPVAHTTALYPAAAVALGAMFLREAHALASRSEGRSAAAIRLFQRSISYLSGLFAAIAADALLQHWLR
jgi:protoheme IX farnesyltransferase